MKKSIKDATVETVGNKNECTEDIIDSTKEKSIIHNTKHTVDTTGTEAEKQKIDEIKTVIKKYDYGNGMYEIVTYSYSPKKQYDINRYVHLDRDTCLDTFTGEVIDKKQPETKADCIRSIQKSMLQKRRMLSFNINPILNEGYCCFITLTFSETIDDLNELSKQLAKFLKKLKRRYCCIKYCCFIEISYENYIKNKNLYHIHCLFWFDNYMNERERYEFKNRTYNDWCGGQVRNYQEITTSKDLNNVLFYLCNYSGESEKSKRKRATLKHFPAYYRLVKQSKDLKKPKGEETPDFKETSKPFSCSSPIASCGHLKLATYIEHTDFDASLTEK